LCVVGSRPMHHGDTRISKREKEATGELLRNGS
jgi:hypothetical protein